MSGHDRDRPSRAQRRTRHRGRPTRGHGTRPRAGGRTGPWDRAGSGEPELLGQLRSSLEERDPLGLLTLMSTLVAMTDPRELPLVDLLQGTQPQDTQPQDTQPRGTQRQGGQLRGTRPQESQPQDPRAQDTQPQGPRAQDTQAQDTQLPGPQIEQLLSTFVAVERRETTAALRVLAEIGLEAPTRQLAERALNSRQHLLPSWLTGLTPITVDAPVEMSHVLGDGDNVLLGVRTDAGDRFTLVTYIDHNLGTLVKDAFVLPQGIEQVIARFREIASEDPDTVFRTLTPADARARVSEAIDLGARTLPRLATDTWPACRPLLEWVVRQLPTGGMGYVRPEWPAAARDELTERFLASRHAHDAEGSSAAAHVGILLWFACDYGPGDPLRWSPVAVELLLTDFIAARVFLPMAELVQLPEVLRAFIRFAHEEQGIRPELTDQTLAAVDDWEPEYLAQLAERGGMAHVGGIDPRLASMVGAGTAEVGATERDRELLPRGYLGDGMRAFLADQVGGSEALAALDAAPLPDEALDLSEVPDDLHRIVTRIAALMDEVCEQLLDIEHRTACRRVVVDIAARAPARFRGPGREDTAAAALIWLVARANDSLDQRRGGLTGKRLAEVIGLKAVPTQRADTLRRALIGAQPQPRDPRGLGSSRYLVSRRRQDIIDLRNACEG